MGEGGGVWRLTPMAEDDLEQVLAIERQSFPQPWSAGLFLRERQLSFATLWVARSRESADISGYVCWWHIGDEFHLQNLAVDPDYRGAGLGRHLVAAMQEEALRRGARSIHLEVRFDNEPARALYGAMGFVPEGRRRNYYGTGQDAVLMTWTAG